MDKFDKVLVYSGLGIIAFIIGLAWGWYDQPDISVSLTIIFFGSLGAVLLYPYAYGKKKL